MTEIPPEVDGTLREWARWAKQRNWMSFRTCDSAERLYSAPLGEVYDDEPRPLPVAALQAWAVECIWRTIPMKERMLVKAAYITAPSYKDAEAWLTHRKKNCRKMGVNIRDFEMLVCRGARMIYNRLCSQTKSNTIACVFDQHSLPLGRERVADELPSGAAFALLESAE